MDSVSPSNMYPGLQAYVATEFCVTPVTLTTPFSRGNGSEQPAKYGLVFTNEINLFFVITETIYQSLKL